MRKDILDYKFNKNKALLIDFGRAAIFDVKINYEDGILYWFTIEIMRFHISIYEFNRLPF